jgi:hypothetical protein
MTNKLAVIINRFKVPKIKKILLYEMKFLAPNYSCLQNPWLEGGRPQIPFCLSNIDLSIILNLPKTNYVISKHCKVQKYLLYLLIE